MDLKKLLTRAAKRFNLPGTESDYVTLLRIPTRITMQIDRSRFKGLNLVALSAAVGKTGAIAENDNQGVLKLLGENPTLLDGYDGGYSADLETLTAGIDAHEHSITDDSGKAAILDASFWSELYISNEPLFKTILEAQKDYQAEMNLGEAQRS